MFLSYGTGVKIADFYVSLIRFLSAGRMAWNPGSLPDELRQIETPRSCETS